MAETSHAETRFQLMKSGLDYVDDGQDNEDECDVIKAIWRTIYNTNQRSHVKFCRTQYSKHDNLNKNVLRNRIMVRTE